MSRIAVLHTYFDILGGGEYLALNLVEALKKKHDVTVYTVTRPDRDMIKKLFNIDIDDFNIVVREEYNFLKSIRGRFIRLKRIMSYRRIFRNLVDELGEYDFVIDTQSNIPSPVDLAYIHYPAVAEAFSGSARSLYDLLVKLLYKRYFGRSMSGRIACNSRFTARAIYKYYHVIPDVIHPPVDTMYFFGKNVLENKRNRVIVTVSRFSPEKNIDLIPFVAKMLKRYEFWLIGFMDSVGERIVRRIERNKPGNLFIVANLDRDILRKTLHDSMIYLHPPFREHFGISVVEAMSAGLVPVVYKESGACEEIVSRIDPRLCYSSIEEIPTIIRWIEKKYHDLQLKSLRVSALFDKRVFQKKIFDYVEKLMKIKGVL